MSWVATAIIGGAVIGGVATNNAANRGAQAQTDAANQANDLQWRIYNQNREDMGPWRTAGAGALGQLSEGIQPGGRFMRDFSMEDFQADPGYDFRMREGIKALERSRAARGGLYSGATGKAIARYGQDYASGEYTNAFNRYMMQRNAQYNRLAGVSGTGQTATEQLGNQGMQLAGNVGNNLIGAGNARASGYMAGANALNGAIGQGVNGLMNYQWLNYMRGNSPGSAAGYDIGSF